jgi:hypothetical protein
LAIDCSSPFALGVGAALFGWMVFADGGLGLAREQHLLIGGVMVYRGHGRDDSCRAVLARWPVGAGP